VTHEVDGMVVYRTDPVDGARIGVLPATCKGAVHRFALDGYTATLTPSGVILVRCPACYAAPADPLWMWRLMTVGREPDRMELDDAPYGYLREQRLKQWAAFRRGVGRSFEAD
jgi:hypothetical protein